MVTDDIAPTARICILIKSPIKDDFDEVFRQLIIQNRGSTKLQKLDWIDWTNQKLDFVHIEVDDGGWLPAAGRRLLLFSLPPETSLLGATWRDLVEARWFYLGIGHPVFCLPISCRAAFDQCSLARSSVIPEI